MCDSNYILFGDVAVIVGICQILLEGQKSEIFCVGSIPTWQCLGRKHKRTGCCNPSRTVNAGEFPSIKVVILYRVVAWRNRVAPEKPNRDGLSAIR